MEIEILPNTQEFLDEVYSQQRLDSASFTSDSSFKLPSADHELDSRQYYLNTILNEDIKKARNEDITAEDILAEVSQ